MKIDRRSVINTKPYSVEPGPLNLVIKVNEDENMIHPGDFDDNRIAGLFTKVEEAPDDCLKLIGYGTDGIIYVSEKLNMTLTDEEFYEWAKRNNLKAECQDSPDFDDFDTTHPYLSFNRGVVNEQ